MILNVLAPFFWKYYVHQFHHTRLPKLSEAPSRNLNYHRKCPIREQNEFGTPYVDPLIWMDK